MFRCFIFSPVVIAQDVRTKVPRMIGMKISLARHKPLFEKFNLNPLC